MDRISEAAWIMGVSVVVTVSVLVRQWWRGR